jgi:hypothetical protein
MTLKELEAAVEEANAAWHGPDGNPLLNPGMPTEVAIYRATLEVAYQLAILNQSSIVRDVSARGNSLCVSIEQ